MEVVFKFLIRLFPNDWVLILNEHSLDELFRRKLAYRDDDDLDPNNSAQENLFSRIEKLVPKFPK